MYVYMRCICLCIYISVVRKPCTGDHKWQVPAQLIIINNNSNNNNSNIQIYTGFRKRNNGDLCTWPRGETCR